MRLSLDQSRADRARMEKFICERIPGDATRIDLGGGAWADLTACWDDEYGWSLLLETDEPEWVDLWEVYQHFRRKEMTAREWWQEFDGEMAKGKVHDLEKENLAMGYELNQLRQTTFGTDSATSATSAMPEVLQATREIAVRLSSIESKMDTLVQQRTIKDWYSTKEVAMLLGKKEYTVREWCRLRRVISKKLAGGRGNEGEWRISHEELIRIQTDGLLPIPLKY